MEENRVRTPITVHISKEVLERVVEALKADKKSVYDLMSPDTKKLIYEIERSQRLTQRDYEIVVY